MWRRLRARSRPRSELDRAGRVQAGVLIATKLAHGRELAAAFSDEAFEALWYAAEHERPVTSGDLLCGVAAVPDSVASRVLASLGLDPSVLRAAVERAGSEPDAEPADAYRATASAAGVLELAAQEAFARHEGGFDAADVLIATVREPDGVGGRALRGLGLTEARLRRELASAKRPKEH